MCLVPALCKIDAIIRGQGFFGNDRDFVFPLVIAAVQGFSETVCGGATTDHNNVLHCIFIHGGGGRTHMRS